jgi:hypothetical protein
MFSPLHFVCLESEENKMEFETFLPFVLAHMRMMSSMPVNETYTGILSSVVLLIAKRFKTKTWRILKNNQHLKLKNDFLFVCLF